MARANLPPLLAVIFWAIQPEIPHDRQKLERASGAEVTLPWVRWSSPGAQTTEPTTRLQSKIIAHACVRLGCFAWGGMGTMNPDNRKKVDQLMLASLQY